MKKFSEFVTMLNESSAENSKKLADDKVRLLGMSQEADNKSTIAANLDRHYENVEDEKEGSGNELKPQIVAAHKEAYDAHAKAYTEHHKGHIRAQHALFKANKDVAKITLNGGTPNQVKNAKENLDTATEDVKDRQSSMASHLSDMNSHAARMHLV